MIQPSMPSDPETLALVQLGHEVRSLRTAQGMTRAALAEHSGLSVRFLAELEGGTGNISYLKLRRVASALGIPVSHLVGRAERDAARPVVLLGMRGAGKTSVGRGLAERLGTEFLELDELVSEAAGTALDQIFELQGVRFYRRLERDALRRVLEHARPAVIAAGGGIVTEPETFELLRRQAHTVWLRATPEDHWSRVVAQGDRRPMRDRPEAMSELVRLWRARSPLYEQADLVLDTSGRPVEACVAEIAAWLPLASTLPTADHDDGNP
jgi:XRE family aerobic/anaerobic benzoate catabolism transcriptional regulator